MDTLILYYSVNGHCSALAEKLQAKVQGTMAEIRPLKPLKGFFLYFLGGYESIKQKPRISSIAVQIENFSKIVLISPVWASSIPSPVRYILEQPGLRDREITVIFSAASGLTEKAEAQVRELLPLSKTIGLSLEKAETQEIESVLSRI